MIGSRIVLGVDCGKTGALAFLGPDGLIAVADMPDATGVALGAHVRDLLVEHRPTEAWVERTQAFPNQGGSSAHNYGRDAGVILGALGAFDVPTEIVGPHEWKRSARLGSNKNASRQRATELWPAWSTSFARVKDDGRAEAALIARHGWLQRGSGT